MVSLEISVVHVKFPVYEYTILLFGCNIFSKVVLMWCICRGDSRFDRLSGSGSSYESIYPSRKRARKECLGGIDLNLLAEVVDRN